MAKMKWINKEEIDVKGQASETNRRNKVKFKGKSLSDLSSKDKDELLERMARDLGYL